MTETGSISTADLNAAAPYGAPWELAGGSPRRALIKSAKLGVTYLIDLTGNWKARLKLANDNAEAAQ